MNYTEFKKKEMKKSIPLIAITVLCLLAALFVGTASAQVKKDTTFGTFKPKTDTLIILKLSDYKELMEIVKSRHAQVSDAVSLKYDIDTVYIDRRKIVYLDTVNYNGR